MRSFAAQAPCGAPGSAAPCSLLPLVLGGLLCAPCAGAGQNPPLPPPSQAQQALQEAVQQNPGLAEVIRQRLLQSGLTPEQVRARLQASGYPANLFDAYLGGAPPGAALPAGALELAAVQALGLPQVGQVFVANLTLDQLRDVLYARLGRVYSGVRRSNATTRFDISVANVRTNQVYVVGEVAQPGACQISSLGTVLTALYVSGGVTERADMRAVELRRLGKTIATLDLYDYLLRGDTRG